MILFPCLNSRLLPIYSESGEFLLTVLIIKFWIAHQRFVLFAWGLSWATVSPEFQPPQTNRTKGLDSTVAAAMAAGRIPTRRAGAHVVQRSRDFVLWYLCLPQAFRDIQQRPCCLHGYGGSIVHDCQFPEGVLSLPDFGIGRIGIVRFGGGEKKRLIFRFFRHRVGLAYRAFWPCGVNDHLVYRIAFGLQAL